MAVEDKYVDSNLGTSTGRKLGNRAKVAGAPLLSLAFTFETAAADDDGSKYRIARLPANAIPLKFDVFCDAITAGTDYDIGLYKPGVDGAVVDKDILADGLDMSSAAAITAAKNGLQNLGGADPLANIGKKLWELAGLTVPGAQEYDLVITANTVGSAAGTISGILYYALG